MNNYYDLLTEIRTIITNKVEVLIEELEKNQNDQEISQQLKEYKKLEFLFIEAFSKYEKIDFRSNGLNTNEIIQLLKESTEFFEKNCKKISDIILNSDHELKYDIGSYFIQFLEIIEPFKLLKLNPKLFSAPDETPLPNYILFIDIVKNPIDSIKQRIQKLIENFSETKADIVRIIFSTESYGQQIEILIDHITFSIEENINIISKNNMTPIITLLKDCAIDLAAKINNINIDEIKKIKLISALLKISTLSDDSNDKQYAVAVLNEYISRRQEQGGFDLYSFYETLRDPNINLEIIKILLDTIIKLSEENKKLLEENNDVRLRLNNLSLVSSPNSSSLFLPLSSTMKSEPEVIDHTSQEEENKSLQHKNIEKLTFSLR